MFLRYTTFFAVLRFLFQPKLLLDNQFKKPQAFHELPVYTIGGLGIFSILFDWISKGINIPVLDNGDNIYQFVHAEDLASACILASSSGKNVSYYNIGSEDYGTMRETLENLCKYFGNP